ncbi:MAG TPA: D-glycero-beta-D-manno-heptose 1-phosphate adenylyltransferase [Burkholderiales bacterium]|nr:D-glycero-beta-D-manno-heptose 1-phosphate adenylyltransferase [Burkholderiales bacterium]
MTGLSVPGFEAKIVTAAQLASHLPRMPRPLVFTNGCFDILHRGHVTYLAQARALGGTLVVGVNSDESVRGQGKGRDRPINVLSDRMAMLAALASVDYVVAFADETPLDLILLLRPDILVKGGDWPVNAMVGSKEVESWGGRAVSIPFLHAASTTALLEKIRQRV